MERPSVLTGPRAPFPARRRWSSEAPAWFQDAIQDLGPDLQQSMRPSSILELQGRVLRAVAYEHLLADLAAADQEGPLGWSHPEGVYRCLAPPGVYLCVDVPFSALALPDLGESGLLPGKGEHPGAVDRPVLIAFRPDTEAGRQGRASLHEGVERLEAARRHGARSLKAWIHFEGWMAWNRTALRRGHRG